MVHSLTQQTEKCGYEDHLENRFLCWSAHFDHDAAVASFAAWAVTNAVIPKFGSVENSAMRTLTTPE